MPLMPLPLRMIAIDYATCHYWHFSYILIFIIDAIILLSLHFHHYYTIFITPLLSATLLYLMLTCWAYINITAIIITLSHIFIEPDITTADFIDIICITPSFSHLRHYIISWLLFSYDTFHYWYWHISFTLDATYLRCLPLLAE